MDATYAAALVALLIFLASVLSVEAALSEGKRGQVRFCGAVRFALLGRSPTSAPHRAWQKGPAPPKPSGRWPARSWDRGNVSNCVANRRWVWYKQSMQEWFSSRPSGARGHRRRSPTSLGGLVP
jgi:hypothetical protein